MKASVAAVDRSGSVDKVAERGSGLVGQSDGRS